MQVGDNILVYGTLKSGHGANRCYMQGKSEFIRNDRISAKMYDLGAFPAIKAVAPKGTEWGQDTPVPFMSDGPTVVGEVYRVTDETLPGRLDNYEGYPDFYDRREFETESGEKVWAYTFRKDPDERLLVPSGNWG
jgi:gamma-glutamylcyclotransferase (GGCT)/AIG2-like uncharacterized protein YtfP